MSDMDVFVIDDDFDPLADLELVEEGEGQETDYMPPIPDADKSVMPEVIPLTPQERIEKLLAGIPGQQFRLLRAVELCAEPKTLDEVVEVLDVEYPQRATPRRWCAFWSATARWSGLRTRRRPTRRRLSRIRRRTTWW